MSKFPHPTLTEGPLGFPMTDAQAQSLESVLKTHPRAKEFEYEKAIITKAPTELNPGERSDVSWISTECVDRQNEIMIAKGMDDSHFAMNPIVTLNHCYGMPPIGKSLWRKFTKDGAMRGIKAKTIYPPMPDAWTPGETWPPDQVLALVQAGLLNAKSIGYLPLAAHYATEEEAKKLGCDTNTRIVDEWILLEYSVVSLPANPEAIVDMVAKSAVKPSEELIKAIGWNPELFKVSPDGSEGGEGKKGPLPERIHFTPLSHITDAIEAKIKSIDIGQLVKDTIAKKLGRV